jgi:hypothetical protein
VQTYRKLPLYGCFATDKAVLLTIVKKLAEKQAFNFFSKNDA